MSDLRIAHSTRIYLPNSAHTEALGGALGRRARPGDVVLLHGALGAGKTAVARGFVRAICGDSELEVTSPTYLLTNEYSAESVQGKTKVYHMDLWRLESAAERPIVDFERVFQDHVSLIEWPDRLGMLCPKERLDVLVEHVATPSGGDDDGWGFPQDDDDEVIDLTENAFNAGKNGTSGIVINKGRIATLLPNGSYWEQRVKDLAQALQPLTRDESNGTMLFNLSVTSSDYTQ